MAVKGISRQVIVVQSPDPQLFDQAIFILKEDAVGITEEQLMKEANRLIQQPKGKRKGRYKLQEVLLIGIGATVTGALWLITSVF